MADLAIVNAAGLVVTIVRGDGPPVVPPAGCTVVPVDQLPAGWQRAPSTAPVPEYVTRWQMRTWLLRNKSVTPANVTTLIEAIQDTPTRLQAEIDWEDSPIVRRDHPLIDTLGQTLGMSSAQIDDAFREAAALER